MFIFPIELVRCIFGYGNTPGFSWAGTPLSGMPAPKVPLLVTMLNLHHVFFPSLANVRTLPGFSGRIYDPAGHRVTGKLI